MYEKKLVIRPFYHTAEKLDFIGSFSIFWLQRVLSIHMPGQPLYPNESDLEVLRQRFLLRNFFSSPCYPFSTEEVFFFVFELFQRYSASKEQC